MLFPTVNFLYFYSVLSEVCEVPNMTVFCSSLISCFPSMLRKYFLNDSETVPVAPSITGIIIFFTFHSSLAD